MGGGWEQVRAVPTRLLLGGIAAYRRFVSPALPPRCRFAPTCSAYAAEAIRLHGAARGSVLALRRVLRCHPFHPGGLDPVPPKRSRPVLDGGDPPGSDEGDSPVRTTTGARR